MPNQIAQQQNGASMVGGRQTMRAPRGGFPWRILIISMVVFGLSVVVWAGMIFGYTPYLESQIRKTDAELTELTSRISPEDQERFVTFYSQLYNIDALSTKHLASSAFFDFLEEYTYSTVLMNAVRVEAGSGDVRLDGVAASYDTLTEQIAMYRENPSVNAIVLDTSRQRTAQEGGGVTFSLRIVMSPSFFIQSFQ